MSFDEKLENLKIYMDYLIFEYGISNHPIYYCKQTRNYEGGWDCKTFTSNWDLWLTDVPKLEVHYLCGTKKKWSFDEFVSEQHEKHYCPDRIETFKPIDRYLAWLKLTGRYSILTNGQKEKFHIDCINKMMEIAGYNTRYHHLKQLEALGLDYWYDKYTWTEQEESAFMAWYLLEAKKRFPRLGPKWLKLERGWFMLCFGLRTV